MILNRVIMGRVCFIGYVLLGIFLVWNSMLVKFCFTYFVYFVLMCKGKYN